MREASAAQQEELAALRAAWHMRRRDVTHLVAIASQSTPIAKSFVLPFLSLVFPCKFHTGFVLEVIWHPCMVALQSRQRHRPDWRPFPAVHARCSPLAQYNCSLGASQSKGCTGILGPSEGLGSLSGGAGRQASGVPAGREEGRPVRWFHGIPDAGPRPREAALPLCANILITWLANPLSSESWRSASSPSGVQTAVSGSPLPAAATRIGRHLPPRQA